MNVKDETICRLCFKTTENEFELIDETTRKMLDGLFLKMNLNVSKDPVICKNCIKILSKSYRFKSVCLGTEKQIDFFAITKEEIKFELNDVSEHKEQATIVKKDSCTCRFCLTQLKTSSFVSIDILIKEASFLDKLTVCMPEMDFNIIKNAVICGLCRENLDHCFNFIQNCLDIEEKINRYLQDKGIVNDVEVKISDIRAFLFENSLDIKKYTVIKQEPSTFDEKEYLYSDTYKESIKTELDIKDEVTVNENLSTSLTKDTYDEEDAYERNNEDTQSDPSNVQKHKCLLCTYETNFKASLTRHQTLMHKDTSKGKMKCVMCTYETADQICFKRHMLTHDILDPKNFICGICTYETSNKNFFKRHVFFHSMNVKRYKCGMCTYQTNYANNLNRHE